MQSFSCFPICDDDLFTLGVRPFTPNDIKYVRSVLFDRVARIGAFAKLMISADCEVLVNLSVVALKTLTVDETCLAVLSAALAIDAVSLHSINGDENRMIEGDTEIAISGFTFSNIIDLGDVTKEAFDCLWPVLAAYSLECFTRTGVSQETLEHEEWLSRLCPLVSIGLRRALATLDRSCDGHSARILWSQRMTPEEFAICCIYGLRGIVRYEWRISIKHAANVAVDVAGELLPLLRELSREVLLSTMNGSATMDDGKIVDIKSAAQIPSCTPLSR
ncbi:MAG: hypothetical protein ACREBR_00530 [bacterium]